MGKPPQQLKITFKDDFICVFQSQVHQTVKTLWGEGGDVYGASSNFWYSPLLWCCVYMTMMEESDASHGPNLIHISWKNTIFVCLMFEVWPQCGQSQPVSVSDLSGLTSDQQTFQTINASKYWLPVVNTKRLFTSNQAIKMSGSYFHQQLICAYLFSVHEIVGDGGAACPCWWFLI